MTDQHARWSDVRSKRPVDEAAVAAHKEKLLAEERAYQLREIRRGLGVTQVDLAARLAVTQPTISALESGELERSALATVRAYVEALGGTISVTAHFAEQDVVLA